MKKCLSHAHLLCLVSCHHSSLRGGKCVKDPQIPRSQPLRTRSCRAPTAPTCTSHNTFDNSPRTPGRTTKLANKTFVRRRSQWSAQFFSSQSINYSTTTVEYMATVHAAIGFQHEMDVSLSTNVKIELSVTTTIIMVLHHLLVLQLSSFPTCRLWHCSMMCIQP